MMLKDRRELMEKEIDKQKQVCFNMYKAICSDGAYSKNEYAVTLGKLSSMITELDLVSEMIESGHE